MQKPMQAWLARPSSKTLMASPQDQRNSKKNIRLHCGGFLIRRLWPEDATERWASWGSDPEAVETLNTSGRSLSKRDIVDYIKSFDQKTHLLAGIFEKATQTHVGILRLDIDYRLNGALVSLLIGEPAYRNTGVTSQVFIPTLDCAFNTLGLDTVMASVLLRHKALIRFMLKTGWKMEERPRQVKSSSGASMLEVRKFTLTRQDWIAWKSSDLARQVARFSAISPLLQAARRRSGNDS
jgi:RimJ/RimL family protein N-acetyltransferase